MPSPIDSPLPAVPRPADGARAERAPKARSTKPRSTKPRATTPTSTDGGTPSGDPGGQTPARLIDARIAELGDWRGATLARLRAHIHAADPEVVEEWKWRGVPVWSHDGILCTGETYQQVVKLTFMNGASLDDPSGLFNASLDGNTRRAIDVHEGEVVNADAFRTLIRAAVALNRSSPRGRSARR